MKEILEALCARRDLSRAQSEAVFGRLVRGELSEAQIGALLVGLRVKGETPEEIAGAASALRRSALPLDTGAIEVVDTCGTGGDGAGTVNISTAAALVAAEAGLAVAKHGNRSISSSCGSADVLEACGVKIDCGKAAAETCLAQVGICFLFAPLFHPGMRHAMPVRRGLGVRTIFNVLGPLCNPAGPRVQVMGVYDQSLCRPIAHTLGMLGARSALVVHGSGLDEIALHGETKAARWRDGRVEELVIAPEDAGFAREGVEVLRGGAAGENAKWLRDLLAGRGQEAHANAVALNAGALLWTAGKSANLADGASTIMDALASGRALSRLERLAELSHGA